MRLKTRTLILLLCSAPLLALWLGSVWAADGPSRAAPPADLKELADQVIEVTRELDDLVNLASTDPRQVRVDMYNAYKPTDMKARRAKDGAVFAEELVEIMKDSKAPFTLRRQARDALKRGTTITSDPELSGDIKKRPGTNRGYFYRVHVVPLLADKRDAKLRKLTQELLASVFGEMQQERAIFKYDPSKAGAKTWVPAKRAWGKHLLKR